MIRDDVSGGIAILVILLSAAVFFYKPRETTRQAPAPVKVELTPEVRYEIQKQVQREVRKLTKPVLPMVAPNPKVKR